MASVSFDDGAGSSKAGRGCKKERENEGDSFPVDELTANMAIKSEAPALGHLV